MNTSPLPLTLLACVALGACVPAQDDDEATAGGTSGPMSDPEGSDTGDSSAQGGTSTDDGADETADETADDSDETAGDGSTGGVAIDPPSCEGLETLCNGESCCTSIAMPGGSIRVGRSETGNDSCPLDALCLDNELPEHEVNVDAFSLDKYAVTVGRFRQFVAAWDDNWRPTAGDGAHPSRPESGWDSSWGEGLPGDLAGSLSCADWATWSETPGNYEDLPISCVNWYQAQAFCIWDGGRLPTEAEYEFAAAGGEENRLYPWGGAAPDDTRAVYDDLGNYQIEQVGSRPEGAGRWGHLDLSGNMSQWAFDCYSATFYDASAASADNPMNIPAPGPDSCPFEVTVWTNPHTVRGNGADRWDLLRAAYRNFQSATDGFASIGVRCARDG